MKLREHAIPLGGRILAVAAAASEAAGRGMQQAARKEAKSARAVAMVRREVASQMRGERLHQLDPEIVKLLLRQPSETFWTHLVTGDAIAQLLAAEPAGDIRRSTAAHIDTVCATFADLVDTRTPLMGRHGVRMARLTERVAAAAGLRRRGVPRTATRRAAASHRQAARPDRDPREAGRAHRRGAGDRPAPSADRRRHPAAVTDPGRARPVDRGTGREPGRDRHVPDVRRRADGPCGPDPGDLRPLRGDDRRGGRIVPALARAEVWRLLEESATEPLAKQALSALRVVVEPN